MDLSKEIHDDESRWSEIMDWPLMVAAAIFLVAYAIPILHVDASPTVLAWCSAIGWATWALFAVDYVMRFRAASDKGSWFVRHLIDLVIIILPMFRQLRLLRMLTVLLAINRHAAVGLRGRTSAYLLCGSLLLCFVASLAVLDAERGQPDANIADFGDSLWWSLTTMTTVGYGDQFPVTDSGRLIAAALMICGIGLLGTVTAMLASWFSDRVTREDQKRENIMLSEVRGLRSEVTALREELAEAARSPKSGST